VPALRYLGVALSIFAMFTESTLQLVASCRAATRPSRAASFSGEEPTLTVPLHPAREQPPESSEHGKAPAGWRNTPDGGMVRISPGVECGRHTYSDEGRLSEWEWRQTPDGGMARVRVSELHDVVANNSISVCADDHVDPSRIEPISLQLNAFVTAILTVAAVGVVEFVLPE
jgi:hypothetical protein